MLTKMLKENYEFKELIKQLMPSPKLFISNKNTGYAPFSKKNPMLVPYTLEENSQACLLGTASDYMFRFLISRYVLNNKENVLNNLAAEHGLEGVVSLFIDARNFDKIKITKDFEASKEVIKRFIYGEDMEFDSIIRICVWFAQFEHFYRGGEKAMAAIRKDKEPYVERELKQLCDVFMDAFFESNVITPDSDVVYNPHFGEWSIKVGGADADIYIDGVLYDFKCTKYIGRSAYDNCAQVYAYFLLALLDKRSGCIGELANKEIKGIALYYSRHGLINSCQLVEGDTRYDFSEKSLNKVSDIIEKGGYSKILATLQRNYDET